MKKLYRNHAWVSLPDLHGQSFFGLSTFAKTHFLRLKKINYQHYFKTNYGLKYHFRNQLFLQKIKGTPLEQLPLSQKMQYDRFAIRRDQPFFQLLTAEFDVEISAPIEMRVIKENYDAYYYERLYQEDWIFKVQILNKEQILELLSEEQYSKEKKFITYV